MSHKKDSKTKCIFELTYKPINSRGFKFINNNGESKVKFLVASLGSMLKYYGESGKMYAYEKNSRFFVYLKDFTKTDKLKIVLNKLILYLYINRNKKSFLSGNPIYLDGSI